jgi:hypothetical protein
MGRRGVISSIKLFLYAVATCRERGVGTLWLFPIFFYKIDLTISETIRICEDKFSATEPIITKFMMN